MLKEKRLFIKHVNQSYEQPQTKIFKERKRMAVCKFWNWPSNVFVAVAKAMLAWFQWNL